MRFCDSVGNQFSVHHVLLAHGKSLDIMRANGMDNLGIYLNFEPTVPASDLDADVAAEQPVTLGGAQVAIDEAALLDRRVRKAATRVDFEWGDDGAGGAGLEACRARAAGARGRRIKRRTAIRETQAQTPSRTTKGI